MRTRDQSRAFAPRRGKNPSALYAPPPPAGSKRTRTAVAAALLAHAAAVVLLLIYTPFGPAGAWFWPVIATAIITSGLLVSCLQGPSGAEATKWRRQVVALVATAADFGDSDLTGLVDQSFTSDFDFVGGRTQTGLRVVIEPDLFINVRFTSGNDTTCLTGRYSEDNS